MHHALTFYQLSCTLQGKANEGFSMACVLRAMAHARRTGWTSLLPSRPCSHSARHITPSSETPRPIAAAPATFVHGLAPTLLRCCPALLWRISRKACGSRIVALLLLLRCFRYIYQKKCPRVSLARAVVQVPCSLSDLYINQSNKSNRVTSLAAQGFRALPLATRAQQQEQRPGSGRHHALW